MIIISKPIYKGYAFSKSELDKLEEETIQKYKEAYPSSIIKINIEPDPEHIVFDGARKEFSYQVIIEY